jgi:hypothetical protein
LKLTPFEVYKIFLSLKNHFTKDSYDYFKYCGKTRASLDSFNKRKDKYFFERLSRKKSKDDIVYFFVANFIETDNPNSVYVSELIRTGEDAYIQWNKRTQSLFYMFQTEIQVFLTESNFNSLFECKVGKHPEIVKKHLQNLISIETLVILDIILKFSKDYDKKLDDPLWELLSMKIKKYKPFLNIEVDKYVKVLKELICE